jgi:hypothetical protein
MCHSPRPDAQAVQPKEEIVKISKWVDFGQEVEIDMNLTDVRCAIGEACERVTNPQFEEEPTRHDVVEALSRIGLFLKALTDEQIALLNESQRSLVSGFLAEHAKRFEVGGLFVTDSRFKAAPPS